MSRYKYVIKKGDTLENIAENLKVPIEELRYYHNLYCELEDLIGGNKLPKKLTTIIIPNKELVENTVKEISFTPFSLQQDIYEVVISSYLQLGEGKLNETELMYEWGISSADQQSVMLEVLKTQNIKVDGRLKPWYQIIEEMNKPLNNITLFLSEDKTIKNVINKVEIQQKWEKIKYTQLRKYELQKESYKELIKIYDEQYQHITENIQYNILYQLFFYPLGKIESYRDYFIASPQQIMSIIFPEYKLEYNSRYTYKKENNEYHIKGIGLIDKSFAKQIASEYKKKYASLLKKELEYDFTLESQYIHDSNGKMKEGLCYFREKVNDNLFYVARYQFKLKTQDE